MWIIYCALSPKSRQDHLSCILYGSFQVVGYARTKAGAGSSSCPRKMIIDTITSAHPYTIPVPCCYTQSAHLKITHLPSTFGTRPPPAPGSDLVQQPGPFPTGQPQLDFPSSSEKEGSSRDVIRSTRLHWTAVGFGEDSTSSTPGVSFPPVTIRYLFRSLLP